MIKEHIKKNIKIVGVDIRTQNSGSRRIKRKTPRSWLESLGNYLLDLYFYESYEITKLDYKFTPWIEPYIPFKEFINSVVSKLKSLGILPLEKIELKELRKLVQKLPYDIVVICSWPYEFFEGTIYDGNLRSFKGNGDVLPCCTVNNKNDTINCGVHEIIEFYFGEKIWIDKNFCKNPYCCMYYDDRIFSHMLKDTQKGLCEECKRKLYENWIPSLKNYTMK